ncbi:aminopeptidase N [Gammaproteobacteria bacterium]|nr:aminopeptidase N [Gammaproteobacteria bacterium]
MANHQVIQLKDYQNSAFFIDQVHLTFHLSCESTVVESQLIIKRNQAATSANHPKLQLNGEQLKIKGIWLDGQVVSPADYQYDGHLLTLQPGKQTFELTTHVEVSPAKNKALAGLYESSGMLVTQCEPHGFRHITFYLDRPDVLATFTTTLIADQTLYPDLLANGNQVASKVEDGKQVITWHDPWPKPCYLFALVAGKLTKRTEQFTTRSGRTVQLHICTQASEAHKTAFAMQALKQSMAWDEQAFDRVYDLDVFHIVAVPDFNFGAMENKSLNIFNSQCVLADPKTTTDGEYARILAIIGHEYFHNWSGNRVTCRDWFQITLKEGLTVYREQCFDADMGLATVKRIADARQMESAQFLEDASPMAHPIQPKSYIEVNNFYTLTVYEKGAEVIRMLASLVGKQKFKHALNVYFKKFDGQAVTTQDFLKLIREETGHLLPGFERWYDQVGTPTVKLKPDYDANQKTLTLLVSQQLPDDGQPLVIPIRLALLDNTGKRLTVKMDGKAESDCLLVLDQAEQVFQFTDIASRPVISALRSFSAPVKLELEQSGEDLIHLAIHETDGYINWRSVNLLQRRILSKRLQGEQSQVDMDRMMAMYQQVLQLPDLALTAQLMVFPTPMDVLVSCPGQDILAISKQIDQFIAQVAGALEPILLQRFDSLQSVGEYCFQSTDVAKRALKTQVLGWLVRANPVHAQLCEQLYTQADNMTDRWSALTTLSLPDDHPLQAKLGDHFLEQGKQDLLVVDKWFRLQGLNRCNDPVAHLNSCVNHSLYDRTYPNRVSALIGVFCHFNITGFYHASGQVYRWLIDYLTQTDQSNPQLASRLFRPLLNAHYLDAKRQSQIHQAIQGIDRSSLSRDLFEMVQALDKQLANGK